MHKIKLITFLILIINISTFAQQWSEYIENDFNRTKSELNLKSLLITGSWFAGMYLLSFGDEYLNENAKRLNKGYLKHYFKAIDNLGYGPVAAPVSIGLAGISLLSKDRKFRRTALTSVESMAVTALIVYSLKIGIGRKRPIEKQGALAFDPFGGWDESFPSGHTSTAFALITPWVYYYKRPWTYLLFALPASTALSRMIYDKHWATDVLTGGAIGYVVGYYLSKWHQDFEKSRGKQDIPPMVSFSIPF